MKFYSKLQDRIVEGDLIRENNKTVVLKIYSFNPKSECTEIKYTKVKKSKLI